MNGQSSHDCSFGFLWRYFVVCLVYPLLPLSLDCPLLISSSVFSDAYLSCVLCTQCYHCLWIVHSWLILGFSLTLICPVSCVPRATIVSGLSIPGWSLGFPWRLFVLCLVYPVLPLSLDCPFGYTRHRTNTRLRKPKDQSGMDNPETMVALGTQDTGQISVRENPRINQEWIIQRQWWHWVHKTQDK
jgi:hypothetical protein